MSTEDDRSVTAFTGPRTRRTALHAGGLLLGGLGAIALQRGVAAQATPTAGDNENGLLLVQSFSNGSLFPTQGDAGGAPYTVILWDAADRGFFFTDWASAAAGVVPAERVLAGIVAENAPQAVLVAAPAEESDSATPGEGVWALSLVYGSLGSDPGAVTYQGEPLTGEDAAALLGSPPADLPDGPQDLGSGYLIVAGLSGFDLSGDYGVPLAMT